MKSGWSIAAAAALLVAAAVAATAGCNRPQPQDTAASGLRIVSFSPAISRTLVDLALGDAVVGRTPFCTSLPQSVAVVGDLQHVDYERLVRLRPTHVLVQPPASGVDEGLVRLAGQEGWALASWKLESIDDIRRLLSELPDVLGDAAGAQPQRRAQTLLARIDAALEPSAAAWQGRLLLVDSTGPVMVYGSGTWLDQLASALGARNASNATGWKELSLEDVARLDPGAIVLVAPDSGGERIDPREHLGPLAKLDVTAVREGRLAVLRHPDAWLPASSIAEVAEELRSILRAFGEDS